MSFFHLLLGAQEETVHRRTSPAFRTSRASLRPSPATRVWCTLGQKSQVRFCPLLCSAVGQESIGFSASAGTSCFSWQNTSFLILPLPPLSCPCVSGVSLLLHDGLKRITDGAVVKYSASRSRSYSKRSAEVFSTFCRLRISDCRKFRR
jgi:hypothetical protein